MNIFLPGIVGLFGGYLYQRYAKTFRNHHWRNYVKSFVILILLQLILMFCGCKAECIKCPKCIKMWLDQSDQMLDNYQMHFAKCESLYENIRLIKEHHKYDTEDAFVSGACGTILALQVPDARARMITIGLTVAADFFKESYYCHRALRRYAEDYRREVFLMEKCKDQLLENTIMCSKCSKQYEYENYDGLGYYRYLEYWKSWYDDLDARNNFGPGCYHTYKKTYKYAGEE